MSFNKDQFESLILDALEPIDDVIRVSDSALNMLLGTAAQESHFGTYLRQLGNGPALGVFQMEPATHDDIWRNFIEYQPGIQAALDGALDGAMAYRGGPQAERMAHDLHYAAIMCRIHYYRVPEALPAWNDVNALAAYWKEHYNTHLGAGTVEEFVENYKYYVE
ncbi:MAG: hypothetical protein ACR2PR_01715 [Pseudohongiellaceae bacterium]